MIKIEQPTNSNFLIQFRPGMDGDDAQAVLYRKEGKDGKELFAVDLLMYNHNSNGTLRANDNLTLLYIEEENEIVPNKETVHHPAHYNSHPEGIEAYLVTMHENYLLGNCIKYIMRHGLKGKDILEDIDKAIEYLSQYRAFLEKHGAEGLPQWRAKVWNGLKK